MSSCEKCWSNAYMRSLRTGKTQVECYFELLEERKNNPCSLKDQAGQYLDEEKQCDIRLEEDL